MMVLTAPMKNSIWTSSKEASGQWHTISANYGSNLTEGVKSMKHYLYAIGAILCWASLPAATGSGLADLSTEELMFFSFSSAAIFITALLGMFGAALVISSGKELNFGMEYMQGYMLALFCGLIWASFSVTLGHIRLKREPMTTFTIYAALLSAGLYRFTLPMRYRQ